ncbi:MAG: metal-dependent hydrolase [Bacteroidota bacterium]
MNIPIKNIFILILLWIIAFFAHKCLVPNAKTPLLIAIFDSTTHGFIAFVMIFPFLLSKIINWKLVLIILIPAVLIDIDHAIVAHSVAVEDMIKLETRPLSHSLLFSLGFSLLFALILRIKEKTHSYCLLFYSFFLTLSSHILRDSINSKGTFWAYPFDAPVVSEIMFFVVFVGISMGSVVFVKWNFEIK